MIENKPIGIKEYLKTKINNKKSNNHPFVCVTAGPRGFEFDGYNILLRDRIKGYRNSKFEKCSAQISTHNKQIKKIRPPQWAFSIEGIDSSIRGIKQHGIWPAVESIYNSVSSFYIGPIASISDEFRPAGEQVR